MRTPLRPIAVLARAAVLWPLALQTGAALAQGAVPYSDPYVAERRNIEVTDDSTALLIVAESFDSAFRRRDAAVLREFVERREWLQTLGEPQPAAANVGDVLDMSWPESLTELRARGGARTFAIALVQADVASAASSSEAPASGAPLLTLTADLAVTNRGTLPVAALQLAVTVPAGPNAAELDTCEEHGLDPIAPGETRVVHCVWQGTATHLQALQQLLAAHGSGGATIAIQDIGFGAVPRARPAVGLRDAPVDVDLRRVAVERAGPDGCRARGDCRADPAELALALLPWLVIPGLIGMAVGRRSART